ncbi:hypothetical protein I2400191J7_09460 [Ruminococcus bicirculans (ex Wegman et al. 2014)]
MIFTSVRSTIFDTNPSSKKAEFILSKDCIATTAVSTTMEKTHNTNADNKDLNNDTL